LPLDHKTNVLACLHVLTYRSDVLCTSASMIPPQFTDRLQHKEVKEGESVRFTIRVSGRPPPEVTWYREGSQIVSSADFEILQDGDLHALYIPEVFYEDAGKYTVKAMSKAGQAHCTAELVVEGTTQITLRKTLQRPLLLLLVLLLQK